MSGIHAVILAGGRATRLGGVSKPDLMVGGRRLLSTAIAGLPTDKEVSRWYLKFRALEGRWSSGRYDLRLDDDGFTGRPKAARDTLEMRLYRRIVGFPGEPKWRKARIRRPRFVRRIISVEFDVVETQLLDDAGEVGCVYRLRVENRTDKRQKAKLDADSARTWLGE